MTFEIYNKGIHVSISNTVRVPSPMPLSTERAKPSRVGYRRHAEVSPGDKSDESAPDAPAAAAAALQAALLPPVAPRPPRPLRRLPAAPLAAPAPRELTHWVQGLLLEAARPWRGLVLEIPLHPLPYTQPATNARRRAPAAP